MASCMGAAPRSAHARRTPSALAAAWKWQWGQSSCARLGPAHMALSTINYSRCSHHTYPVGAVRYNAAERSAKEGFSSYESTSFCAHVRACTLCKWVCARVRTRLRACLRHWRAACMRVGGGSSRPFKTARGWHASSLGRRLDTSQPVCSGTGFVGEGRHNM